MEIADADRYDCGSCTQPNSADVGMVACDTCGGWHHYACVGVSPGVENRPWRCRKCPPMPQPLPPGTGATKKQLKVTADNRENRSIRSGSSHKVPGATGHTIIRNDEDQRNETPKKNPEIKAPGCYDGKSAKSITSSALVRAQLALNRLEEERLLEETKLKEERIRLEEERIQKDKERMLRAKEIEAQEKYLREKRELEELLNAEDGSQVSVHSGTSKAKAWLENQRRLKLVNQHEEPPEPAIDELSTESEAAGRGMGPTTNQLAARQIWPRKLPMFSGEPDEWPIFYSSYETANAACGFSNVENIIRLRECLRGPARDAVVTKLMFPHCVTSIMETLRRLYGRPEVLIKNLLNKVRRAEAPKPERLDTLMNFGMAVQQLCDHLEAANLRSHLSNPTLLEELVEKLPASIKLDWVRYKRTFHEPSLKEFGLFMEGLVADASEVTTLVHPKVDTSKQEKGKQREKGHLHTHAETEDLTKDSVERQPCSICGKMDHRVRNCEKFQQMNLDQRLRAAEKWKLCEVCLFDHGHWKCRSRFRCNVGSCRLRHHPLLHRVIRADCHTHDQTRKTVLFRMIPVTLFHGTRSLDTHAFLDEGSSLTLVEASAARSLGIEGEPEPLELQWTSNIVRNEKNSRRVDIQISPKGLPQRYTLKAAHTINGLNLPKQSLNVEELRSRYVHLRHLPITSYSEAEPKVLIGLQNLELFAPLESRVGQPGDPIAVRSVLGWAVYGSNYTKMKAQHFLNHHKCDCDADKELNEMIRQRFVLEDVGAVTGFLPEPAEVRRARDILKATTRRVNGRFETGLLWKVDDVCFPDSQPMAFRRMKALETKLAKDPDLKENVHQQIKEYVRKHYAHKASKEELAQADTARVWYLPLNVVSHPRKPEKKRLVWDAAAKVDGVSLNSRLLKGPDLLTSLPSVICKFRERRVGFGGDIREMFHQIRIRSVDKHSQRFLFRFDTNKQPDVYIMDVATFGATCSPCSAQHVMKKNAEEFVDQFPDAAKAIEDKTYMDDYFDSAETPEEATTRALQVRAIHEHAGFEMRNWVSSSPEVLRGLGEISEQKPFSFVGNKNEQWERVLGMMWDPTEDMFVFTANLCGELAPYVTGDKRPTKRIALRCIMSLFDPLGLLAPYLVHGRMLIQDIWRSGVAWDEEMLDVEFEKWERWTALLQGINQLKIPRFYFGHDMHSEAYETLQLHVFTDASQTGYGCAAYFRIVDRGEIRCSLVMARSKVAPLKYQSIPRLELQAAVLGARLMQNVCDSHTVKVSNRFLWTDSTTVLSWIRSDHKRYLQYVAHRVGEIQSLTDPDMWRWVSSKENVADALTKWGRDTEPDANGRWFTGASIIKRQENDWPIQKIIPANSKEELRAQFVLHHIAIPKGLVDASRISKWTILVRTMAVVLRFIANCRLRAKGLPAETVAALPSQEKYLKGSKIGVKVSIRQSEYLSAEQWLWRIAQSESYPDEVKILLHNRNLPLEQRTRIEKASPIYKDSPFADEFGVLRVDGRTAKADYVAFDARFPIILPRDHLITLRIVDYYHRICGHIHRETVMNEMRQRYNIDHLRSVIDKVIKDCHWCRVKKCKPQFPRMAPLPAQRLTAHVRPFSYVGVDYMGPLDVTVGRRKEKRYVAVFTCLVVRAIHLEVSFDLSTDSCIMAIRRFVRRRGSPVEIFSDNGTNFVGASRELQEQIKQINAGCAETFTDARTKWTFNPPSAPHMGGVWERMVRSVKVAMRAIDDGRKLTDEILLTVLAEVEGFINARPLTYMPQDSTEHEALTPNHFLFGNTSGAHEPITMPTKPGEALRSGFKRSQYLADAIWDRWLKEYFPTINKRSKWLEEVKPVRVGDLVYIAEGNRRTWVRGKIEEVIVASDGRIRQAMVRTASGMLKRPVAKLAVMELGVSSESEKEENEHHPDSPGGGCSGNTRTTGHSTAWPIRSNP
ncbi:uncharacterized protein LOC131680552 [Topomyia yanbarensis]|uniref:uncharacterized protein LOC131680552 n=1 Tax=Topomyia yanbarensis TaxID=2498891 RepID=UPI00273B67B6|nr:uncharacterized protein LOC131680552 [Topomyia yanbarensis]